MFLYREYLHNMTDRLFIDLRYMVFLKGIFGKPDSTENIYYT